MKLIWCITTPPWMACLSITRYRWYPAWSDYYRSTTTALRMGWKCITGKPARNDFLRSIATPSWWDGSPSQGTQHEVSKHFCSHWSQFMLGLISCYFKWLTYSGLSKYTYSERSLQLGRRCSWNSEKSLNPHRCGHVILTLQSVGSKNWSLAFDLQFVAKYLGAEQNISNKNLISFPSNFLFTWLYFWV